MQSDKTVQSPDTKPGISANHGESMQKKIPFLSSESFLVLEIYEAEDARSFESPNGFQTSKYFQTKYNCATKSGYYSSTKMLRPG